jgi:hypothetical protein
MVQALATARRAAYFNPATARLRASNRTASRHTPITVNDNTVVMVPSA